MQKRVETLIKKVAEETKLPEELVKAIVESQFQCAREATKRGEAGNPATFLNIRFRHLGILVSRPNKILKMEENGKHANSNKSIQGGGNGATEKKQDRN